MMRIAFAAILLLFASLASALEIDEAKAQGLVGEALTGYLAPVRVPASVEVSTLIEDVNTKREALFERTATKTSTTVLQVRYRFYELAVQRTEPGHYYQDTDGSWIKK